MVKRLRAWTYSRIDSKSDAEEIMRRLEKDLYDYAEKMGFIIVGSSRDYGSGLEMNRPGLLETMKAAGNGRMDVLLVKRVECIGRDTAKIHDFLCGLEQLGIFLYSPQEGEISLTQPQSLF